jgi:subtilase family serine protease
MSDLRVERDLLDRHLPAVFAYLSEKGYRYTGAHVSSTPALGAYVEASFHNPTSFRRVTVSYAPPLDSHPDVLLVF